MEDRIAAMIDRTPADVERATLWLAMTDGPTVEGLMTAGGDALVECDGQLVKWGVQSHSQAIWYAILGEEFGEVGKAICEIALGGRGQYTTENLRTELIHCAAVAISMCESLARAGFDGSQGD